jgi:hypothetical protein
MKKVGVCEYCCVNTTLNVSVLHEAKHGNTRVTDFKKTSIFPNCITVLLSYIFSGAHVIIANNPSVIACFIAGGETS